MYGNVSMNKYNFKYNQTKERTRFGLIDILFFLMVLIAIFYFTGLFEYIREDSNNYEKLGEIAGLWKIKDYVVIKDNTETTTNLTFIINKDGSCIQTGTIKLNISGSESETRISADGKCVLDRFGNNIKFKPNNKLSTSLFTKFVSYKIKNESLVIDDEYVLNKVN